MHIMVSLKGRELPERLSTHVPIISYHILSRRNSSSLPNPRARLFARYYHHHAWLLPIPILSHHHLSSRLVPKHACFTPIFHHVMPEPNGASRLLPDCTLLPSYRRSCKITSRAVSQFQTYFPSLYFVCVFFCAGRAADLLDSSHLLSSVNESLLNGGNPFLFLDVLFDLLDGVIGFDVQFDFFACEGSDSREGGKKGLVDVDSLSVRG